MKSPYLPNRFFKERLIFALFISFCLLVFAGVEYLFKKEDSMLAEMIRDFKKSQQVQQEEKVEEQPTELDNPFLDDKGK